MTNRLPTIDTDDDQQVENAKVDALVNLAASDAFSGYPLANSDLTNDSITLSGGDGLKNGSTASLGGSFSLDIEPVDFAGNALEDDGSDNLAVTSNGIQTSELDLSISPTWTGSHDFTGATITVPDPTSANHAADKEYVDSVASGLNVKDSVVAATDGASIDLTSTTDPNPIDGVTLANGERVLLKDQSTSSENGIYVAQTATDPSTWTRASDFDEDSEVTAGAFTFVEEGTNNGDKGFVVTSDDPIAVGTDAILFGQFSGAGQITAGDGIKKSGDTLNIEPADFAGSGLQDDGTDDLELVNDSITLNGGDGLKNGSTASLGGSFSLDIEPADFAGSGLQDDGTDDLELTNDTVTVAGNAVSLGGSTGISHSDLSTAPSDAHHAQDQSANYKDGGIYEIDVAEFGGWKGTAGQVPQSDNSAVTWTTLGAADISDVSADSVSDAHHAETIIDVEDDSFNVVNDIHKIDFDSSFIVSEPDTGRAKVALTDVPGSTVWNQRNVSSTVTLSADDSAWVDASGGTLNITLPTPTQGAQVRVIAKDASNTITVSPNGTEKINGSASDITMNQNETLHFESDGTDWWIV